MSKREIALYIEDALEAVDAILSYVDGLSYNEFYNLGLFYPPIIFNPLGFYSQTLAAG